MRVRSQESKVRSLHRSREFEVQASRSKVKNLLPYPLRTLPVVIGNVWIPLALLWSLLAPVIAIAQTSGGATISLYGVIQVEPGSDVATLEVKGEMIRFAIQNVQCADRGFSTGGFLTDITRKEPGLHLKGAEEWLEMLINEPPSKRAWQMTGVYYKDSRMFVLNKLARFNKSPGIQ